MIAATVLALSSIATVGSLNLNFPYLNNLPEIQNEGSYKIVHGIPTDLLHHPYQAAIYYGKDKFICSGAILNKKWIVSIVIGADPTFLKVAVGINKINEQIQLEKTEIEKIIIHPNWTAGTGYCLSLFKLKTALKFSKNVQEITIAEPPKNQSLAVITGWGTNTTWTPYLHNTLLKANLSVIDKETCKKAYVASLVSNTSICGFKNPTTFAYKGDCGDPLVQDGKLVGVNIDYFNFLGYCLDRQYCPVLFTDLTVFKQWIEKIIKEE
ncbi:trypsin-7-like isoform X2 [Lycorma delicatula]|uniref:trypsin-7-like isoform X2 n=1 Tax=Lycorma delicatula TaxID=130591 RepID=UPI003F50EFF1